MSGFSFATVARAQTPLVGIERSWVIQQITSGHATEDIDHREYRAPPGELSKAEVFGITAYSGWDLQRDGVAKGEVFSSADGVTYWVRTEAPHVGPVTAVEDLNKVLLTWVLLGQTQYFRKDSAMATYDFVITHADIDVYDGGPYSRLPCSAVQVTPSGALLFTQTTLGLQALGEGVCNRTMAGYVFMVVFAHTLDGRRFFSGDGGDVLNGTIGQWEQGTNSQFDTPLWTAADIEFRPDYDADGTQRHARAWLRAPRTVRIDLSSVAVGEVFAVDNTAFASAEDQKQLETYVTAYMRDPSETGGVSVATTGLTPVAAPLTPPLWGAGPDVPAECVGQPRAGYLQFQRSAVQVDEIAGPQGVAVDVMRLFGSNGAISVNVTTVDDSARAGQDYLPRNTTLSWSDGDPLPKRITVPLIDDPAAEGDKTFSLTLSAPTGCAVLRGSATTLVTIRDNAVAAPGAFTLGGTLSGLAGTGLVLGGPFGDLSPVANGPFTMPGTLVDGLPYTVRLLSQPANPAQVCALTNASGVVAGANVTNVQVVCSTPAPASGLDSSFGTAGKAFNSDFESSPTAVALQSSGKIIVVGNSTLSRFNVDGSLDTSFATGGHANVVFFVDSSTAAQSVTVQPDDKIIVVGAARVGTKIHMAVARYQADGTLDTGFGSAGLRTIDPYVQLGTASRNGVARRALVAADGKIYVAGNAGVVVGSNTLNNFAVARLHADGSLDTSYSGDGAAANGVGSRTNYAYAIGIQTDGKVVLAGAASNSSLIGEAGIGLARFKTDGNPDSDDPRVPSNYGPDFAGISLIDPSFFLGTSGGVSTDVDMVMLPDDFLVVASSVWVIDPTHGTVRRISLLRVGAQGGIQNGPGGVVVPLPAGPGPGDDLAHALVRLRDGKFIVVGQVSPTGNLATTADFAVLRFNADLTPDLSFGAGGVLLLDFFGGIDNAVGVVEQPDGKIVVVGSARNGTRTGIGIARLN